MRLRGEGDPSGRSGHVGSGCFPILFFSHHFKNERDLGSCHTCTLSSCVLRCCKVHDECYATSRRAPGCTAIADLPYVLAYDFTCSNPQVTCSGNTVTRLHYDALTQSRLRGSGILMNLSAIFFSICFGWLKVQH